AISMVTLGRASITARPRCRRASSKRRPALATPSDPAGEQHPCWRALTGSARRVSPDCAQPFPGFAAENGVPSRGCEFAVVCPESGDVRPSEPLREIRTARPPFPSWAEPTVRQVERDAAERFPGEDAPCCFAEHRGFWFVHRHAGAAAVGERATV